ncbi:MAG: hypothetical protein ACKO7W_00605 [Elainella sp.]
MINLNSAPPDRCCNSASSPEADLLDEASLETVLLMLEVIDCIADLALLETLTPNQKRQVWDATPPVTRLRLKQLRSSAVVQPEGSSARQPTGGLSPSVHRSYTTPLLEATELMAASLLPDDEPAETNQEETAAIDLESQREEIDLMLQEPLDLTAQPTVHLGDWVVLHAQPKLSKAEMLAIWQVIEVQGNYARIATQPLGSRVYPMSRLSIYPKPAGLEASSSPAAAELADDAEPDFEPDF